MQFADVIVDISVENLDKTYQYRIPKHLQAQINIGTPVMIPFGKGNRQIKGFVLSISDTPKFDPEKTKELSGIVPGGMSIEAQLLTLASFIRTNYGGTLNDALKTVIPVKKTVKQIEKKTIRLKCSREEAQNLAAECMRKKYAAKLRLLEALLQQDGIDFNYALTSLKIPRATIKAFEEQCIISLSATTVYRNPLEQQDQINAVLNLNEQQQAIVDQIKAEYEQGQRNTYLVHGVTGSGKTEVYMELIDYAVKKGRQAIVLIPEIALTYQTVLRFRRRFQDRVSILNSKMSAGERFDQIERAKSGQIDIMIGPRSALFTPFPNLGLIIIDEEHEASYKSEMPPKYHAREVAIERARLCDGIVVLGSATPSVESFKKAKSGEYQLMQLTKRAKTAKIPTVHIIDLKDELKNHNKSIFSRKLRELITDRLEKKEQIMLFLNRRGFAGFVSCRACGHVMKCPHCDISLTSHNNGTLKCHYCGYDQPMPSTCPECGSKYIAAFGTGTQKVEAMVHAEFPNARVLRMDADTTKSKTSYEDILSAFANKRADILIGTQMIVKGHDFEGVTLVGILAADLSLYASDYRAAERTYELLAQAAGRAGRGELAGEVVIQTYQPDHYAVTSAATQDYERFYENEMNYRRLMKYPPAAHIMAVLIMSKNEEKAKTAAKLIAGAAKEWLVKRELTESTALVGPSEANLSKVNDIYRQILYVKEENYEVLTGLKDFLEDYIGFSSYLEECTVQFDFDPMNSY